MNARHTLLPLMIAATLVARCETAQSRSWREQVATPFDDPLLARPPQLEEGKLLPGDSTVHACSDQNGGANTPLMLADAIDLALCHHPQIKGAWARIKVQAAQAGEARAAYLPAINAGLRYQQEQTRQPEALLPLESRRRTRSQYYMLTWRLLDFGTRNANLRSADALLEAALASHDAVLQKTMAGVIAAYYEVQISGANRQTRERNETLAHAILQATQRRAARGMAAQSDLLQVQTALSKAELEHARAIGQYEKSLVTLSIALGLQGRSMTLHLPPTDTESATNTIQLSQELERWRETAQQQHPALVAARAQLAAAREKLTATRSEGLPSLDFSHGYYVNGRPNQGSAGSQTREAVTGLVLNIPLFDGFSHTYKVRNAQAQTDLREAELLETEAQVLGELANAFADTQSALRNLASSQRLLESARTALENVQRKYERGLSDLLDILNVQAALADASQERIRALAEWHSARLRLLASAGELGRTRIAEHSQ